MCVKFGSVSITYQTLISRRVPEPGAGARELDIKHRPQNTCGRRSGRTSEIVFCGQVDFSNWF